MRYRPSTKSRGVPTVSHSLISGGIRFTTTHSTSRVIPSICPRSRIREPTARPMRASVSIDIDVPPSCHELRDMCADNRSGLSMCWNTAVGEAGTLHRTSSCRVSPAFAATGTSSPCIRTIHTGRAVGMNQQDVIRLTTRHAQRFAGYGGPGCAARLLMSSKWLGPMEASLAKPYPDRRRFPIRILTRGTSPRCPPIGVSPILSRRSRRSGRSSSGIVRWSGSSRAPCCRCPSSSRTSRRIGGRALPSRVA